MILDGKERTMIDNFDKKIMKPVSYTHLEPLARISPEHPIWLP